MNQPIQFIEPGKVLTPEQAMEALSIKSRCSLSRYVRELGLKKIKLSAQRIGFRSDDINDFLNSIQVSA